MSIAARRVVRAPINVVREELARVAWEKQPDQIPRTVRAKRLGLTQGGLSHQSFSLGYEYEWNNVSVELWGRLSPTTAESTTVSYRCGIDTRIHSVALAICFVVAALWWSDDDAFMSILVVVLGSLSFVWIVVRNARIGPDTTPEAKYLVERIDNACDQAEARHQVSVRSA